ncbi:hypothetical protein MAPG_03316 [Magnaporthiopsis poae ATCC 64411]|uniref:Zn(2)-C6 fungal-type domain-containing protein n=1 Tax=Magnaporthiopsis poae (strain ATCC 64411 / 73-15) TaxID=644358 RepID=A0A0C4DTP5_MAGP6|nr:hypothetical protein MAPG_03316 [Magnaporthiopsis poae ATCC 64411]
MAGETSTLSVVGAGVSKNKGPRACTSCAKAKSRCHPGPLPSICERCHRLKKSCSSQTPAPPRKRKEARPNRMAELERRLQDLTSKLQPVVDAQQQQQQQQQRQQQQQHQGEQRLSPPVSTPGTTEDQLPLPLALPTTGKRPIGAGALLHLLPDTSISAGSVVEPDYESASATSSPGRSGCGSGCVHRQAPPRGPASPPAERSVWLDAVEAALLLKEYHEHLKGLFPFVVVPANLSSEELRRQRPFLWKAIMIEACHMDGRRQTAMGHQMLTEIAAATLTASAKTLDLLQGIQLLLAWFNFGMTSFQINNLLFLARSLCVSLGLGEPQGNSGPLTSARLEEMRAYAGTYYLVTLTFTSNKKPDALMSPVNVEACCQAIQSRMEHPTDELVVYLVRAQQLIQSISLALVPFLQSAHSGSNNNNTLPPSAPPLGVVVRDFQQRISAFERSVPEHLKGHPALMGHVHVARIHLYEISLHELPRPSPPLQDHPPGFDTLLAHHQTTAGPTPEAERLELLWSCLDACRKYLVFRFDEGAPPPRGRPHLVCLASFDFVVAKLTSLKLWMLQVPGWDRGLARKELDLESAAEQMIEELRLAVLERQLTIVEYFASPRFSAGHQPGAVDSSAGCRTATRQEGEDNVRRGGQAPSGRGGGGGGGDGGPPDLLETLRQRLIFIRTALLSEAQDSVQDGQASSGPMDLSSVGVRDAAADSSSARCGAYDRDQGRQPRQTSQPPNEQSEQIQQDGQQHQQQQQQVELPPPSHLPMADVDLDSWAANLFVGDEDWDPSAMMVFDWFT